MQTFIKTQAALVAGSLADFGLTWLITDIFHCWYVTGNAAGNVAGAAAQFVLSRYWVFNTAQKMPVQILKFAVMWIGCIALSALGVYLLTNYVQLHYLVSKLITSVLLGVTYTYFVSKRFVFN